MTQSLSAGADPMKSMNAPFEPPHTPFDWLGRDKTKFDAFINDPLCFPSLNARSIKSFLNASSWLTNPVEIRKVRKDLAMCIFSGSGNPVRQRPEGVHALTERYRSAGITSIAHDFYPGGRRGMLHKMTRREVFINLFVWISGILEMSS
jgi:alpha-beta hydrolase superfamily lysophospholipase